MTAFLVRRLLSGLLHVGVLVFLTFVVFNLIPTNPACLVVACGPHTTTNDAQIIEADHRLGIDRSVFVQYAHFVWRLVSHADLGTAWTSPVEVRHAIAESLPATASLVAGGMVLMILLAIPLACWSAMRPRSPADRGLLAFSVIGVAVHPFVLGITLRDFFAQHLDLGASGYCPLFSRPSATTPGSAFSSCAGIADWSSHLAVPWLVFALFFLPLYMRMIRVRLLETLGEQWITTARAKGASEARVVLRHALRNAIAPVLPMIAIDAGTAITAAIYIETVFGLNGIGLLAVQAFSGRVGGYDLPLTAGIVLTVGAFVILLNTGADVVGAWIDPRTRLRAGSGLVPLPAAIATRPRARRGLNIGLGAAITVLALIALSHRDSTPKRSVQIGAPLRSVATAWDDVHRLTTEGPVAHHGYIETTVRRIELGTDGWRVHATVANMSPLPLQIDELTDAVYPRQGMSLLVQEPTGYGGNRLVAHQAREFIPNLPHLIPPNGTWRGTFAGAGRIRRGAQLYVGFGQFTWERRVVSTSTASAITG
jgi:peptide/nickel transport system permease protein